MSRSIVFSNRIAPSRRLPENAGLVMSRERIACTTSYMPFSSFHAVSSTPYSFNAFGVLPPLWSRAAMKPLSFLILASCLSNVLTGTPSRLLRRSQAWNFGGYSSAACRRFYGERCDARWSDACR